MSGDILTPEIRSRLQRSVDPDALQRFLLAVPEKHRLQVLERF